MGNAKKETEAFSEETAGPSVVWSLMVEPADCCAWIEAWGGDRNQGGVLVVGLLSAQHTEGVKQAI
jgi:hypothetical protein